MKNVFYLDYQRNKTSLKSLFIVMFYRFSSVFAQHRLRTIRILGLPVRALYKFSVEFVLGVEMPDKVRAGPGLAIFHGVGLVVNQRAVIGSNVTLRQNTTVGTRVPDGGAPVIGDNVDVGAHAVIMGEISVGANSVIGAGAIVVNSCPVDSVVRGSKASTYHLANEDSN